MVIGTRFNSAFGVMLLSSSHSPHYSQNSYAGRHQKEGLGFGNGLWWIDPSQTINARSFIGTNE